VRELFYLESAVDDLDEILLRIVHESGRLEPGLLFTEQLRGQCAKLASLPGTLGQAQPALRPDLRSFPFKGYVILFRYEGNALEVVSIVEGHRDIEGMFAEQVPR
jgi:toxin ParE1/3/4